MADALSLLRQFLINKKEFHEEDDKIIFGDVYYPKDVKTNYLIYGSGQNGQSKDYYSLECIVYLLKNTELAHANYIKNATAKKISVVSRPDRKDLLSYLYGEPNINANVDKNAPIEITMQCPLPLPRSANTNNLPPPTTSITTSSSLNTISSNINNNTSTNNNNFDGLLSSNVQTGTLSSIIQSNSSLLPVSSSIGSTNLTTDQLFKKQHKSDDINSDSKTNFKERITKKIESTLNAPRINENLTELSDKLTVEKVASIKAKFLSNKRKKIDDFDKEDYLQGSDQLASKRVNQTVTGDSIITDTTNIDLTKEILNRERVWRNRITILDSSGKQFDKNIFAILQLIKIKEEGSLNNELASNLNSSITGTTTSLSNINIVNNGSNILNSSNNSINSTSNNNSLMTSLNSQQTANLLQQQKSSGSRTLGYNRYGQEMFTSKDETGGFSIDTKRSYQYNDAITLSTDSTTPSSSQSNVNKMSQLNKTNVTNIKSLPITSTSQKRTHMKPIIVVPAARTALITLYNAIDILQDLKYVSSDEKRKTLQNQNKDSEIILHRREDGKTMQFKIIDNISKLSHEDWDRVVAVFAQGPLWQFKEWPWEGNPIEIFNKIKAFHIKWHGINLDSNISKWSVTVIELDQHRRHLDRAKLLVFWDELDKYL